MRASAISPRHYAVFRALFFAAMITLLLPLLAAALIHTF